MVLRNIQRFPLFWELGTQLGPSGHHPGPAASMFSAGAAKFNYGLGTRSGHSPTLWCFVGHTGRRVPKSGSDWFFIKQHWNQISGHALARQIALNKGVPQAIGTACEMTADSTLGLPSLGQFLCQEFARVLDTTWLHLPTHRAECLQCGFT